MDNNENGICKVKHLYESDQRLWDFLTSSLNLSSPSEPFTKTQLSLGLQISGKVSHFTNDSIVLICAMKIPSHVLESGLRNRILLCLHVCCVQVATSEWKKRVLPGMCPDGTAFDLNGNKRLGPLDLIFIYVSHLFLWRPGKEHHRDKRPLVHIMYLATVRLGSEFFLNGNDSKRAKVFSNIRH